MADIFTTAGEELVADIMDETATVPLDWFVGWGTGATVAAKGDTVIETESAETRLAGAATQPTASVNQWVATLTSLGAQTIANAGLLSLVTGGVLLLHSDFTGIVLGTGDKIEFTFQLTWS
jgi:hypothetical protein